MYKYLSMVTLSCLLLACPAWAGQKVCASPPDSSRAVLHLSSGTNTLYVKGEPSGRFLMRYEWTCRKGHQYRQAEAETIRIPLGTCSQPGKLHITMRQGCAVFEVQSERDAYRGRR